jgi:PIN domain nuclease of toxin-antitoxin system
VIILDSHVLLWLRVMPERLSAPARRAIQEAREGGLAIAAISLYELARLLLRGTIVPAGTPEQGLADLAGPVTVLPITAPIALIAAAWPPTIPGDPGDRLILATARAHGAPLVTADRQLLRAAAGDTIW